MSENTVTDILSLFGSAICINASHARRLSLKHSNIGPTWFNATKVISQDITTNAASVIIYWSGGATCGLSEWRFNLVAWSGFFAATQIPSGKQLLFLTHILANNIRIWIAFRKSQCRVCIKNVMNVQTRTLCLLPPLRPPGKEYFVSHTHFSYYY